MPLNHVGGNRYRQLNERSFVMAVVIAEPCVGVKDTACITVCPVDCIHPTSDEPDFARVKQLFINPQECTSCGLCIGECPVSAIFDDLDLPAQWSEYIERNAAYFRDKT
jgi:ferredoxin